MRYLNLGCGHRRHPAWTNVDRIATGADVLVHDLRQPLPFPDALFDAVYASHLLEHLGTEEASDLVAETWRVLRPEGIFRVAVPDLEQITLAYLAALERALAGLPNGDADHRWMVLELYDQATRAHSGGEAAHYLSSGEATNAEFVLQRWGQEAKLLIDQAPELSSSEIANAEDGGRRPSLLATPWRLRGSMRERLLRFLLGSDYRALQVGRFRLGGEPHLWMYDRFSLACLLRDGGFIDVTQCSASRSAIPNWESFNLDSDSDGTVARPDSLFMEGARP